MVPIVSLQGPGLGKGVATGRGYSDVEVRWMFEDGFECDTVILTHAHRHAEMFDTVAEPNLWGRLQG